MIHQRADEHHSDDPIPNRIYPVSLREVCFETASAAEQAILIDMVIILAAFSLKGCQKESRGGITPPRAEVVKTVPQARQNRAKPPPNLPQNYFDAHYAAACAAVEAYVDCGTGQTCFESATKSQGAAGKHARGLPQAVSNRLED